MNDAISMYLGKEKVYANNCDFNSYSELGLLCPVCMQEVYLRRGEIKKPYFAHFHTTKDRQVKKCSRRVSSDEYGTEISDYERGQSLKIFQKQFLSKFYINGSKIVDDINFNKWNTSKKRGENKVFKNILRESIEYFITHSQQMIEQYIVDPIEINDQQELQQKIALTVMAYLCENVHFNLNLEYLLSYSIYQLYFHNKIKDIGEICQYTTKIIMCNFLGLVYEESKNNNFNNITKPTTSVLLKKSKPIKIPTSFGDWVRLSQGVSSTAEMEIIAINSPNYRDHILVYHPYQLQVDINGMTQHPQWLKPTQTKWGIKDTDIIGYVGVKNRQGSIDKLGLIFTKLVKYKDKSIPNRTQIWFVLLEKTQTQIIDRVVKTGEESKQVLKVFYNPFDKTIKQHKSTVLVPQTQLVKTAEVSKIELHPELKVFLSLYGLRDNSPITPAKLNKIGESVKQINVNWSQLTGLNVAPLNRNGNIEYRPKFDAPFTVVE
ncbi:MAG TPA: hypothetical protein VK184_26485 [Nostocaceae cyanobacterium]|nr:hypothetical protein [Nostocaceae cyanobacterium]